MLDLDQLLRSPKVEAFFEHPTYQTVRRFMDAGFFLYLFPLIGSGVFTGVPEWGEPVSTILFWTVLIACVVYLPSLLNEPAGESEVRRHQIRKTISTMILAIGVAGAALVVSHSSTDIVLAAGEPGGWRALVVRCAPWFMLAEVFHGACRLLVIR